MGEEELVSQGVEALEAGLPIIVTDYHLAYEIANAVGFRHGYTIQTLYAWELTNPRTDRYPTRDGTVKHTYTRLQPYRSVLIITNVDSVPQSRQPVLIQLVEKGEMTMLGIRVPEGTKIILHANDLNRVHPVLLNKLIYVGRREESLAKRLGRRVV